MKKNVISLVLFFALFAVVISCAPTSGSRYREGDNVGQQTGIGVEHVHQVGERILEKTGVVADVLGGGVDLMSNACGELTDRAHLLGLGLLSLQALVFIASLRRPLRRPAVHRGSSTHTPVSCNRRRACSRSTSEPRRLAATMACSTGTIHDDFYFGNIQVVIFKGVEHPCNRDYCSTMLVVMEY